MAINVSVVLVVILTGFAIACDERLAVATSTPLAASAPQIVNAMVSPTPSPAASPTPEPTQTPLPLTTPQPMFTPAPTPQTGAQAPHFQLTLFDGNTLHLSDLKGEVVVLNFWASWCQPCRYEMPAFEAIWQEYRDQGVVFVGVAVSDFEEDARAFSEEVGVTYPLGLDIEDKVANSYHITAMPTTYFIDRDGNVARKRTGYANEGVLRIFIKGQLTTE